MYPFKWRELNKDEEYDGVKINSKECLKVDEPNGLVLPRRFAENIAKKTYSMEVYEDDIWVVSFPKCGTTWTQVKTMTQTPVESLTKLVFHK